MNLRDSVNLAEVVGTHKIYSRSYCHFFTAGVKINENCETEFDSLYAAGEVGGNTYGVNRLAGNSITDRGSFIRAERKSQRAVPITEANNVE